MDSEMLKPASGAQQALFATGALKPKGAIYSVS